MRTVFVMRTRPIGSPVVIAGSAVTSAGSREATLNVPEVRMSGEGRSVRSAPD